MSHTTTVKSVPIKSRSALRSAAQALRSAGINCELVENAVPRMFYENQIRMHIQSKMPEAYRYHANPDECDFILRLPGCRYDIGFLTDIKTGDLIPLFDDWAKSISNTLGAKFTGVVEHWSGQRDDTEQTLHSIGKLLQEYSKQAIMESAAQDGISIESCEYDKEGVLQIMTCDV